MNAFPIACLLLLPTVVSAAATGVSEAPEDAALLQQAIHDGLPDPSGATVWQGAVRGEPAPDPDASQLPGEGWTLADTHLQLADGRWLLHGVVLHAAALPAVVLADGAHVVPAATITYPMIADE